MAEHAVPESLLPPGAKALVFDCDGTLIDSMAYHYGAWRHASDHFGLTFTPAMIVELAGTQVNELFEIICQRSGKAGQVDREEFFRIRDKWYHSHDEQAVLIEPVMRIVRAGQARGLPMAVASGGTRHHVTKALTETGIIDLFKFSVCAGEVARGKPAPDAFLLAAEKLGVDPAHCVGYEDAKLGIQAIEAAGYLAAVDVTKLENYPFFH